MNKKEKKVILISFQFVQKTLRSCLFESNKTILRVKKRKKNGSVQKDNNNSHIDGNTKFWTRSQTEFRDKVLITAMIQAGAAVR